MEVTRPPSCCVCLEEFRRAINPPVSIVPCGHEVCRPCLEEVTRSQRTRQCPLCRTRITSQMPNRALMDEIEANAALRASVDAAHGSAAAEATDGSGDVDMADADAQDESGDQPVRGGRSSDNLFATVGHHELDDVDQRRMNEVIHDDSQLIYCVLDNSGSMNNIDGKIFEIDGSGRLRKIGYGNVSRWKEAGAKCLQVAEYNYKRGVPCIYYLLNPQATGRWNPGVDFVEIEPSNIDLSTGLQNLQNILVPGNVRGTTPLEDVTRYLRQQISSRGVAGRICYLLFTDGEPNSKMGFERELRALATDARRSNVSSSGSTCPNVFLTINLCTDQDAVVEYYNDLDQKIGSELSGMDVLDDLEAEHKEVRKVGNNFVTYCQEIHICRMSGCHSVLADLLDESPLSMFHTVKLVKEVLKLDVNKAYDTSLWLDDTKSYLQLVDQHNFEVYDLLARRKKPIINVDKLRNKIWWYQLQHEPIASRPWVRDWTEWCEDSGMNRCIVFVKWPIILLMIALLMRACQPDNFEILQA